MIFQDTQEVVPVNRSACMARNQQARGRQCEDEQSSLNEHDGLVLDEVMKLPIT